MNLSFGIGSNAGQGSNPIKIIGTCEFNFINEDDSVVITILNPGEFIAIAKKKENRYSSEWRRYCVCDYTNLFMGIIV